MSNLTKFDKIKLQYAEEKFMSSDSETYQKIKQFCQVQFRAILTLWQDNDMIIIW